MFEYYLRLRFPPTSSFPNIQRKTTKDYVLLKTSFILYTPYFIRYDYLYSCRKSKIDNAPNVDKYSFT